MNEDNKYCNINKKQNKLYKPFGLNFITSFCFLFTAIDAHLRNKTDLFIGCSLCLITSLLNHSTYNKYFIILDKLICQFCFLYFIIKCFKMNLYYFMSLIAAIILLIVYKVLNLCHGKNDIIIHSSLHIIGNIGISFMIEGLVHN